MLYRWQVPEGIAVPSGAGGAALIASLLKRRGYTTAEACAAFLNPTPRTMADPFLFTDLRQAVERLKVAQGRGELVAVWGDYDVDGLTSTALLTAGALGGMGLRVRPFIPHRLRDGYGLNVAGIARLIAEGVGLIVAVDCGISNRAEVAFARGRGVDVIVLDHHTLPAELPEAVAVVNPRRADCALPVQGPAAVGVAYTLVRALTREGFALRGAGTRTRPTSSICSTSPRSAPSPMSPRCTARTARSSPGGSSAAPHRLPRPGRPLHGRGTGPRPAQRLGTRPRARAAPQRGGADRRPRAGPPPAAGGILRRGAAAGEELDRLNRERQRELARILEEAIARVERDGIPDETRPILQVEGTGWTAGVVGLVAGRLAERYGRPAIVLERGDASSAPARPARSTASISSRRWPTAPTCSNHYGGHARAAGLTIANDKLEALRERLLARARARLTAEDLRPSLELDLELPLADMTYPTVEAIARLEPFGHGNPEPLILLRDVTAKWPKTSGDGKHLFFNADAQDGRPVRARSAALPSARGRAAGRCAARPARGSMSSAPCAGSGGRARSASPSTSATSARRRGKGARPAVVIPAHRAISRAAPCFSASGRAILPAYNADAAATPLVRRTDDGTGRAEPNGTAEDRERLTSSRASRSMTATPGRRRSRSRS